MIVLELVLYCLIFTVIVKLYVLGGAVKGLYFYPKAVQDLAIRRGSSPGRKWSGGGKSS